MSPVRVLIAPEGYAGLLAPAEAAAAIARGWSLGAPHDSIEVLPVSDGGPGFIDTVARALGGEVQVVMVDDPWGRPTPATMLVSTDGATVYLEAAQAGGGQVQQPGFGAQATQATHSPDGTAGDDPAAASSGGVGDLLEAALRLRPRRIVLGLSGSLVLDAGLGMLGRLIPDQPSTAAGRAALSGGAAHLVLLRADNLGALDTAIGRFGATQLVALGDLHQPLLGLAGVAATHGPALGADPEHAQLIEAALGHAVDLVRRARPERRDLLSGTSVRLDRQPGAGAGAGLGFGLAVLGAALRDGATEGPQVVGLAQAVARADLVVTGSTILGWETLRSSASAAVAHAAQEGGIPAIALCGRVEAGRRETMAAGYSGTYAVASSLATWPAFAADPARALAVRAESVARTWSPPTPT